MKILNLTQHSAAQEQVAAGVIELHGDDKKRLIDLITFNEVPNHNQLEKVAWEVFDIANKYEYEFVMIGGAPFLMSWLEAVFKGAAVYAFSKREVVEKEVDGKVVKTSVFKHIGFVNTMNHI
jgi:hypothetical protein